MSVVLLFPFLILLWHIITPCTADVWSSPDTTGERPPPCDHFSFTSIDQRRAVMFGGHNGKGLMNDIYIIDLQSMVCELMIY